ncbi:uncharacterized protein LOC143578886 [Bidens hawaiensis]|uniref:uncharacterized protein LOC143578886 n=1 Tax=Bidens hawaiensis TaxID=980011 RepID=UPI00404B9F58
MEHDSSPAKRRKILHDVGPSTTQSSSRKKLLALDVNGLLVDIVPDADADKQHKPDTIISSKAVFKRPFCDEFLKFCFERFRVGVWTSRTRRNITRVLDFLMKDTQHQLLFCWDQSHCTETGYNTIENTNKPLLLKELKKLWEKQDPNLPWDRGVYDASNTLLLDDSPYKALRNPPHTAIFPYTYSYLDAHDNGLGPDGDLRNYLERLAASDNVQKFVEQNPFGQPPITRDNISWDFYHKIICSRSRKKLIVIDLGGLVLDVVTDPLEGYRPDTVYGSRAVFKRPYCDEFLQFCFQTFNVGVWTSTTRYNTEHALDFLVRDAQHKLLFCWDLAHCTDTGFRSVENISKNIILKELRKLWEKKDPNLPWELGAYDESNTLLVENVSHRGLLNPPHTAIFPYPYRYWKREDNSLGPDGDLRVYLERLAASENVQKFVSENPFGQRPIREKNLSWPYYQKVINAFSYKRKTLSEPKTDGSTALASLIVLESETDNTTDLVGQTLTEPEISISTPLAAPTLSEPETSTTTDLVGQTLTEPEVGRSTALTALTLLEPETERTTDLVHQTLTEPEVNTSTLAAPTLLEPETDTTDLVGQTLTEPEVNTTARVALTAPTLLGQDTSANIALVGQSQTLSEPEVNTTASAAQILSEPETFTSGEVQTDADNVSLCTPLSAKNKSFSQKRSESNSATNGIGSKEHAKVFAPVLETSGSNDIHQDSPHHDKIITGKSQQKTKKERPPKMVDLSVVMKTCGADDGKNSKKRKRGKPQKFVVKKPIGLLKGTTDLDERPLSGSCEGTHPLPVLTSSSCRSPPHHHDKSLNHVIVTADYQQDWPFIKQSSIWLAIESLMALTPPQKPHFSPLKNAKQFNREGLAVGHMVTYLKLIQRFSCLKPNDPVDIINDILDTLVDLEPHGFDVDSLRSRLNELLSLKHKVSEHDAHKELEKCKHEKILMEKEMNRLKVRMRKLQEKMAQNKSMEKMKDEEITRLQSNLHLVRNQISDLELVFETLAATPL